MQIPKGKKIYFSSDNHLGAPTQAESLPREKKFVKWLDEIKEDAAAIFLLGDLFDFWYDYKTVVPKGFVRVLGKLAEFQSTFLLEITTCGCGTILKKNSISPPTGILKNSRLTTKFFFWDTVMVKDQVTRGTSV
jgi:hypothetical protein